MWFSQSHKCECWPFSYSDFRASQMGEVVLISLDWGEGKALGSPAEDGEWSRDLESWQQLTPSAGCHRTILGMTAGKVPGKKANNSAALPHCPPGNAKVILDVGSSAGFQSQVQDWATLQHQLSRALVSSLLIKEGQGSLWNSKTTHLCSGLRPEVLHAAIYRSDRKKAPSCSTITTIGLQAARCVPPVTLLESSLPLSPSLSFSAPPSLPLELVI